MLPFVNKDENMKRGTGNSYMVRSIYYDTANYTYFHEKVDGLRDRKKIRIRGYNDCTPESVVFLEIKRKKDRKVWKYRAPVRYADLPELLRTGDCERYVLNARPDAVEEGCRFFYHMRRYGLQPTVLVVYKREAFHGKYDPTFRLTFDQDLRGLVHPAVNQLFDEDRLRFVEPRLFVMEVKFHDVYPSWMRKIVNDLELQQKAFSKYISCITTQLEITPQSRQVPRFRTWDAPCQPCFYSGGQY